VRCETSLATIFLTHLIDRLGRASGQPPLMTPVVSSDPAKPGALPAAESFEFFQSCEGNSFWKNEITIER
jgi:hypothetical protein